MDTTTTPSTWDKVLEFDSFYYEQEVLGYTLFSVASYLCMTACCAFVIAGAPMMAPGLALGLAFGAAVTRPREKDKHPCSVVLRRNPTTVSFLTDESEYTISVKKIKRLSYDVQSNTLYIDGPARYGKLAISTMRIRVPTGYREAVLRMFEDTTHIDTIV